MQHATFPGRDTARGTGDSGYLFGRQFLLFHSGHTILRHVIKLSNMGQLEITLS
jgi:hypothetical protein